MSENGGSQLGDMLKNETLFVLVLSILLLSCSKQEVTLPEKGAPFTDSLYNTTIVRITDKEADGYSGPGIQNEYARNDAYSCDESYIMMRGNDGSWYIYDGSTYGAKNPPAGEKIIHGWRTCCSWLS